MVLGYSEYFRVLLQALSLKSEIRCLATQRTESIMLKKKKKKKKAAEHL